jgi:hypothetical protein
MEAGFGYRVFRQSVGLGQSQFIIGRDSIRPFQPWYTFIGNVGRFELRFKLFWGGFEDIDAKGDLFGSIKCFEDGLKLFTWNNLTQSFDKRFR